MAGREGALPPARMVLEKQVKASLLRMLFGPRCYLYLQYNSVSKCLIESRHKSSFHSAQYGLYTFINALMLERGKQLKQQ